jgi:hypothetical protein
VTLIIIVKAIRINLNMPSWRRVGLNIHGDPCGGTP